jgi:ribonuclease-3
VVRFTAVRFEEIAKRIGYRFEDKELLRHALTHSSTRRKQDHYERLEFLGDRVLGLVMAEHLYKLHPGEREGHMSALHSALVRGETCAEAGRALGIEDFIVMGQGEMNKRLNLNTTVLGDVVEALIAGIYLDGGLDAAKDFILRNWQSFISSPNTSEKDAKTFLQEWALARALPIPAYKVVSREGPEHAPVFVIQVKIEGREPMEGTGRNKRLAEQDAAAKFLKREKIRA